MADQNDQKAGKNSFVWPASFVHLEKSKPLFDMEGRAVALLEQIYLNDIDGAMGEQALFFLGNIHLFHENYVEADHYYSQILKFHPNGEYAPKALELAIICKQMSPGGTYYDGRTVSEARDLVYQAKAAYPELAHQKGDFLQRQLFSINVQEAEKDLGVAEFYRRRGQPGSAYFYYELVRRRYPGTKQAEKAAQRMSELKHRVEQEQQGEKSAGWLVFPNPFARKTEAAPKTQMPPHESPGQMAKPGATVGQPQGFSPPQSYPGIVPGAPLTPYPQQHELAPAPRPAGPGASVPGYTPQGAAYPYPQSAPGYGGTYPSPAGAYPGGYPPAGQGGAYLQQPVPASGAYPQTAGSNWGP
jgi:hypothetical protein